MCNVGMELYSIPRPSNPVRINPIIPFAYVYKNKHEHPTGDLMLVIPNQDNVQTGEWNRWGLLKYSIYKCSLLPYIAPELNIVILNPNENKRRSRDHKDKDGTLLTIPGSETPDNHIGHVWDIMDAARKYSRISILAHRGGARSLLNLNRNKGIIAKIKRIAFIDSKYSLNDSIPHEFWQFARRFEQSCPLEDEKCTVIATDDPALMPYKARDDIFNFFGFSVPATNDCSIGNDLQAFGLEIIGKRWLKSTKYTVRMFLFSFHCVIR